MFIGVYGESAGARTQDQRLKRAMLYQLSYALEPHSQGSIIAALGSLTHHCRTGRKPFLALRALLISAIEFPSVQFERVLPRHA